MSTENYTSGFSERELVMCHASFRSGHDMLKQQLLDSLPETSPIRVDFGRRQFIRRVVAAAAVVAIVLGVFALDPFGTQQYSTTPTAWANVLDHIGEVESIHVRMSTPSKNSSPSVEMWWRRGHDYRMEFNSGLTTAGSVKMRYSYDPGSNVLKVTEADGPGPELFALGDLGGLFESGNSLSGNRHRMCETIASEKINYRGEICLKVTTQDDNFRYEYIMDMQPDIAKMPLYEVRFYSRSKPEQLRYSLEVLEINRQYPDSLFVIEPPNRATVKYR